MATLAAVRSGSPSTGNPGDGTPVTVAQIAAGDSQNVIDRGSLSGYALLQIANTGGATPTVTCAINGSMDGVNFYPLQYADSATPGTPSVATFTLTTTGVAYKVLQAALPWRYLKLTLSAVTNETVTATLWAS